MTTSTPTQVQSKAKLTPEAKEIMLLAEQRGYTKEDIINAGLLSLGRLLQREQDKLISTIRDKKAQEAANPPEPIKSPT